MAALEFGYIFWNPIVWVIAFVVVMAVAYFLRSRGQKKYKKDTAQTQIFLCGEEVPEAERRHVKAHNVYWGLLQTLKGYYNPTTKAHTGIINDYIIWFTAIAAATAVILFIVS